MKRILFVCAMEKETKEIIQKLNLIKKEEYYEKDNIRLLITGIGKQKTAISLATYLAKQKNYPKLVINVGFAGSTDIQIGTWVQIEKAYNYEWNIPKEERFEMLEGGSQELIRINSKIERVPCYSSESFVTETFLKGHIAFDMELHSISLLCDKYKIPLISLKKISDNLSIEKYYETVEEKLELASVVDLLQEIIK